jgi:hypothetical protein
MPDGQITGAAWAVVLIPRCLRWPFPAAGPAGRRLEAVPAGYAGDRARADTTHRMRRLTCRPRADPVCHDRLGAAAAGALLWRRVRKQTRPALPLFAASRPGPLSGPAKNAFGTGQVSLFYFSLFFKCLRATRELGFWCARRDSNPHDFTHCHLKAARLPIPPRALFQDRHQICVQPDQDRITGADVTNQ